MSSPAPTLAPPQLAGDTRRPYHHGHLRDALIDAALQIIAEDGLERLTIRALAERVGVSHAAPQYHFADKAALIVAVATRGFEQLDVALARPTGDDEPSARLLAMGRAYIEFALANPAHYRLMFATGIPSRKSDDDAFCDAAARTLGQLTDAIAALGSDGATLAEDEEAATERVHAAALFAWSAVHGAIMLQLDGTFSSVRAEDGHAATLPPMEQMMPALLEHVAAGLSGVVAEG